MHNNVLRAQGNQKNYTSRPPRIYDFQMGHEVLQNLKRTFIKISFVDNMEKVIELIIFKFIEYQRLH
jgi:hypothetical protein